MKKTEKKLADNKLIKSPTGIQGFDEITDGGVPAGRLTLVCGGAGCGKTLFGMEFLVRGATQFNEPGVFMSFEETNNELIKNVSSLGFDLVIWDGSNATNQAVAPGIYYLRIRINDVIQLRKIALSK